MDKLIKIVKFKDKFNNILLICHISVNTLHKKIYLLYSVKKTLENVNSNKKHLTLICQMFLLFICNYFHYNISIIKNYFHIL